MTRADVASAFGVSTNRVEHWLTQAQLVASHPAAPDGITEMDVLRFVRAHRAAFHLRTVDQVWFLDLVLGTALDRGDSRRAYSAMQRHAFLTDLRQTRRIRTSAYRLGVNRGTLYQWARRDPVFGQQLKAARWAGR